MNKENGIEPHSTEVGLNDRVVGPDGLDYFSLPCILRLYPNDFLFSYRRLSELCKQRKIKALQPDSSKRWYANVESIVRYKNGYRKNW